MNRIEEVRKKLEEVESYVTFVKQDSESSAWYVGEDMEKVYIPHKSNINEIISDRVMNCMLKSLKK